MNYTFGEKGINYWLASIERHIYRNDSQCMVCSEMLDVLLFPLPASLVPGVSGRC